MAAIVATVLAGGMVGAVEGGGDFRKFSYRGRESFTVKMLGRVPARIERGGVEVQVAGVSLDGNDLSFNFGIPSREKPQGIVVEDVSSATAIRLVEQYPIAGLTLGEDGRWIWFGQGGQRVLEPETAPWVYREGDSEFVFRFFIALEGGRTVEVFQPAVFSDDFKTKMREKNPG